jgi:hypothetical protein
MRKLRARRAVLLGLALFVLSQAGFAVIVLSDAPSVREPPFGRKLALLKKRLTVESGQERPVTVVQVGSSRTAFGLRGQVAERWLSERLGRPVVVFNMGFLGDGPIRTLLKVKQLLNEGIRPDLLLVEVMPPLLAGQRESHETAPGGIRASQLRYGEMRMLGRCLERDRPDLEREWWLAQARAAWTYRIGFLSRTAPPLLSLEAHWDPLWDIDASGWCCGGPDPEKAREGIAAAKKTFGPMLDNFRLSPRFLGVICQTIELAQQEGVAVALVVMPEGPTFRGWYPPGAWKQITGALEELSRACAVPYLDFRNELEEGDFSDSHHLHAAGAARFTHRIAQRIAPLLRRRAGNSISPVRPPGFRLQ